jgi:hypothetical protein
LLDDQRSAISPSAIEATARICGGSRAAGAEVGTYAGLEKQILTRAHRSTRSLTWQAFARLAVPPVAAIVLLFGGLAADRWLSGMHLPVNEVETTP